MFSAAQIQEAEERFHDRLKSGDEKALEELYDRFSSALYGVIHKIVKNEDLAQDVLQESFIKIWTHIKTFDPKRGRLFTWCLNIARNLSIDKIRKSEYKAINQNIEDSVYIVDSMKNTETATDTIGVKTLVDKLEPDLRVLIEGAYFMGYTQQELSEMLQIPLGTVKSRMRLAMSKLKEWMI